MDIITSGKILIGSTLKNLNDAKSSGKLCLKHLYLINIINSTINNCNLGLSFETKRCLIEISNYIKFKNKSIQNYNQEFNINYSNLAHCKDCNDNNINGVPIVIPNIAPTVDDNSDDYESIYTFTYDSFTNNFNDSDDDIPFDVLIKTLPEQGVITFKDNVITENTTILLSEINMLKYDLGDIINPLPQNSLTFRTSDNNINKLYSNMATFTFDILAYVNQRPTIGNNSITIENSGTRVFTLADFTTNTDPIYNDPENDNASNVRITSLSNDGELQLNGIAININQIISITDINSGLFTYVSDNATTSNYIDIFTFQVSDVGSNQFSDNGTFTINVNGLANQPAIIGDNTIQISNRETRILTLADFTTNTNPSYSDPENDPLDAIRIDSLNTDGVLQLNGTPVTINQIITVVDINNGLLTFTAPDQDTEDTDTFTWSGRDSGSGQFIS